MSDLTLEFSYLSNEIFRALSSVHLTATDVNHVNQVKCSDILLNTDAERGDVIYIHIRALYGVLR